MDGITTYRATLTGVSPIIHHSGVAGLAASSPIKDEIAALAAVTSSKRTDTKNRDLKMLESLNSLWLEGQRVIVPATAVRACIEQGARKTKDGPNVREGMLVVHTEFRWDTERYGVDGDEDAVRRLAGEAAFQVPVVVGRARILRTRAKFDCPWSVIADIEGDDDLISADNLQRWLRTAGQRIGLGDWRPAKSGIYGRFTATVEVLAEEVAA